VSVAAITTVAGAACTLVVSRVGLAVGPFVGPNQAVLGRIGPITTRPRRYRILPISRYFRARPATNAMLHTREVAGSKPAASILGTPCNSELGRVLILGLGSHQIRRWAIRWAKRGDRTLPLGVREPVGPGFGPTAARRRHAPRTLGPRCQHRGPRVRSGLRRWDGPRRHVAAPRCDLDGALSRCAATRLVEAIAMPEATDTPAPAPKPAEALSNARGGGIARWPGGRPERSRRIHGVTGAR
jgi:hypothetical protein